MKRQRHSPPQRHSSLPPSLHRLLVSGPPHEPHDGDDDADDTSLQRGDGGGEIPFEGAPDPVHPAPGTEPALPSLVLTQAAFTGLGVFGSVASRQQSRSPVPHVAQEPVAAALPALSLPLPPQRILRTDPVYYSSTSPLPATHPTSPPGPHLRPISWSPESPPVRPLPPARFDSLDRSAPPLAQMGRQRSPLADPRSISVTPPSHPVAGPSRLPDEAALSGRKRKAKGKKAQTTLPPQEIASSEGYAYGAHWRQNPAHGQHDFGSSARAPTTGFAAARSEASSQRTARPESTRQQEAGPSPRRIPESGRGSPASLTAENYPVAVGSTAYSVTTLSPLRATILPPVVDPAAAAEEAPHESAPSGVAVSPPVQRELGRTGGEGAEVKRSESDTEGEVAAVGEKRARRGRSEQQESTASSSSEHTQAPKSKKTLIACHFCRARKLRCDGQRPSCANCTKRAYPCTYEPQPKRRGPGKTARAAATRRRTARHPAAGGEPPAGPARLAEAGASGSGSGRANTDAAAGAPGPEAAGPSNAEGAPAAAEASSAATAAVQTGPFPMTRQAFEPQLTGPIPTYPGFAYRPPSASSSHSAAGQLPPFHFYSLGRGMNRSVASDSVRSSNTSNVSSAPSVPDDEDRPEGSVADEFMDFTELEEFYRHSQPRPGPGEDGSQ